MMRKVKSALSSKFDVKDLGRVENFLGIKIVQNLDVGNIWISQSHHTEAVLRDFGMEESKPVRTPTSPNVKLTKATED
jgi:hypothetical protein